MYAERPARVYENVRERTASYENVRDRTRTYELVRDRTGTYGNVQNPFRVKLVSVMHLAFLRGIFRPSGANFGVVFVILASWETSYQHPAGAMASLAWPCTPLQRYHALNLEIRISTHPPHRPVGATEGGSSKSEGNPKLQAQNSETGEAAISDQRVGCRSSAAHGS